MTSNIVRGANFSIVQDAVFNIVQGDAFSIVRDGAFQCYGFCSDIRSEPFAYATKSLEVKV